MIDDYCDAVCWREEYADEVVCTLPPGHPGKHWDQFEGWEWWAS